MTLANVPNSLFAKELGAIARNYTVGSNRSLRSRLTAALDLIYKTINSDQFSEARRWILTIHKVLAAGELREHS